MEKLKSLKINQVKYGAILSYVLIIANALYGFFISPYILFQIGESSYGVYKIVASFSSAIMVLDFGIGTTVMRYTAKFRAENKKNEIENFAAMGLLESAIMSVIIAIVSVIIYFQIPVFYANSFTSEEMLLAKKMFFILSVNIILVIIENVFNGVITGCNQFVFANGTKLCLLLIRIGVSVVLLKQWRNAVVLVGITLAFSVITMILQIVYIRFKLQIRIRLYRWEPMLFKESLGYTVLMFLQTLAGQANGNIDNIVIGAVIGTAAVSVYSFGIQLFNMFETLATSMSGVMLPSISKKIVEGASDNELQESVTRVGRLQFALLAGALGGFIVVGREFIYLWLGEGYEDVYLLSIIMMVPVMLTLVQNVCLSILRAKNMMVFRTVQLVLGSTFNAIFTIIGTKLYGYYAAAIGTGLSILLFSVVMMNIYYHKRIGFKVLKFYIDVSKGIFICATITTIVIYFVGIYLKGSLVFLGVKICLFLILYFILLLVFGLNNFERDMLFGNLINKIRKKRG